MRIARRFQRVLLLTFFIACCASAQSNEPRKDPADHHSQRTVADEAMLLERGRIHSQQNALARLAIHADPQADKVLQAQFERFQSGQLPAALALDLLDAVAKRNNAELNSMLAARQRELEKSNDPLANFRECLEGGGAESGRAIFTKNPKAGCIRCHSIEGVGGKIGPDLTWLRHSAERISLLEAIILPNATIAPGFQSALLKLKNGTEISGVITFESSDDLVVTSVADGRKRKVRTADIVTRTPLPSPMPPYFGAVLSKREIRDLVEFLAVGD